MHLYSGLKNRNPLEIYMEKTDIEEIQSFQKSKNKLH